MARNKYLTFLNYKKDGIFFWGRHDVWNIVFKRFLKVIIMGCYVSKNPGLLPSIKHSAVKRKKSAIFIHMKNDNNLTKYWDEISDDNKEVVWPIFGSESGCNDPVLRENMFLFVLHTVCTVLRFLSQFFLPYVSTSTPISSSSERRAANIVWKSGQLSTPYVYATRANRHILYNVKCVYI